MSETVYNGFPKNIQDALREGNTVHVLTIFNDNKNSEEIRNNSWDLIPIATKYLTIEHEKNNIEVFKCCEKLLNILAERSNAEEAVLQLIEEIEEAKDDTQFLCLLQPLRQVLYRIPHKRLNSFAWCFNSIQIYLNRCEIPEDSNLVGKEKLLMDSNEITQRITNLYFKLLQFYETFLEEVKDKNDEVDYKLVVCKFLIQLLGNPLGFLDMEVFDGIKSKARTLGEKIVSYVISLIPDSFLFIEMRYEAESNELMKPNTLSLAVLFYLLYAEKVCIEKLPKVYSSVYLFQNSLHLSCTLLEQNNQITTEKGLKLAQSILEHVKNLNLTYLLLDSEDHSKFCKTLTSLLIFNELESVRKLALKILRTYLDSFELRGKYLLVYNLMTIINHSGLISYLITYYKDLVAQGFLDDENEMPVYLKGPKLFNLLRKSCHLPKKEESDLIELSDQIIASLNLLRYLFLRDKKNQTKICDFFGKLEDIFFKPLRKGIELSRAHYELKIKDLKENGEGDKDIKVDISVGGANLPEMPRNEKLKVLYSSLTAFDIMDSLLSRLIECIECRK